MPRKKYIALYDLSHLYHNNIAQKSETSTA